MKLVIAKIILFFISLNIFCLSDLSSQHLGDFHKYSKITLTSGQVVRQKNITLDENTVSWDTWNSSLGQDINYSFNLEKVEKIVVSDGSYILPGFILGTCTGIATLVFVEEKIEGTETIFTGFGVLTIKTTMLTRPKIIIVAGGTILGTLIGAAIKKGWESIYINHTSMKDHFKLNFTMDYNNIYMPEFKITYKF